MTLDDLEPNCAYLWYVFTYGWQIARWLADYAYRLVYGGRLRTGGRSHTCQHKT